MNYRCPPCVLHSWTALHILGFHPCGPLQLLPTMFVNRKDQARDAPADGGWNFNTWLATQQDFARTCLEWYVMTLSKVLHGILCVQIASWYFPSVSTNMSCCLRGMIYLCEELHVRDKDTLLLGYATKGLLCGAMSTRRPWPDTLSTSVWVRWKRGSQWRHGWCCSKSSRRRSRISTFNEARDEFLFEGYRGSMSN